MPTNNPDELRNLHRDAVASARRSRFKRGAEAPPHAALIYVWGEPVHFECDPSLETEALAAFQSWLVERAKKT